MNTKKPKTKRRPLSHQAWWDKNDMDGDPDAHFTASEVVWRAAQREMRLRGNVKRGISQPSGSSVSNGLNS